MDVIDIANDRALADTASYIAQSTREKRPAGMVPTGRCWHCEMEFDDETPEHRVKLFCPAEPGQVRSDCVADYERRKTQQRMLGRV